MSGASKDRVRSEKDHVWSAEIDMDGLGRFLRDQHPQHTAKHVAARTRRPVTTVKKWLSGEAEPAGSAMVLLFLAYGLELVEAVAPRLPACLDAAARAERQHRLKDEIDERRARLQALDL